MQQLPTTAMGMDEQMAAMSAAPANDVAIHIHGFETRFRLKDGKQQPYDVVIYSPLGDRWTRIARPIDEISRVLSLAECGDNISAHGARRLWERIEPEYQAWKNNQELPVEGTPLGAWSGISQNQATVLRNVGIRTVEEMAAADDTTLQRAGVFNGQALREMAKKYLASQKAVAEAEAAARMERENAELRAALAEMQQQMKQMQAELQQKKPAAKPKQQARS